MLVPYRHPFEKGMEKQTDDNACWEFLILVQVYMPVLGSLAQ